MTDASPAPLDRFMSVAAHDLRNPIAVLRGSAQMALRQIGRNDVDAARRRIEIIIAQSDRLNDMIEMFSDAARLDMGTLEPRLEPLDLAEVVRTGAERARLAVGEQLASRALELDVAEGCTGTFDRARLARAVRALVENAYAYGDPQAPVRVRLERRDDRAHLVVSGGGEGPTLEETPRLFERFFRGHAAAEAGYAGSGLGLYTARGIARGHGGDVRPARDEAPDAFELVLPLTG